MLKVGYRIFLKKNSGGVSLGDDSDSFGIDPGHVEERASGFDLGASEKTDFEYIEANPPEDQVLVTYTYDPEDAIGNADSDGNLRVRRATVKAAEDLMPSDLPESLLERLTYDQLYRFSEPKRKIRSHTVRGPALEIDPDKLSEFFWFNFKSYPSTTGLRHRGYARFFKPRGLIAPGDRRPVEKVPCLVDCSCPDYRYRWAWANKQRGSGAVGPNSLNQALNRAPRKTNPSGAPGMCKHLLAMKDYVYGITSDFPSTAEEPKKFKKNLDYATKRWINFPGDMAKARERDRTFRANRQAQIDGTAPDNHAPSDLPEPEPLPGGETDPEVPDVPDSSIPGEGVDAQRVSQMVVPDPPKVGDDHEPEEITFSGKPSFLQRVGEEILKKESENKTPTQESVDTTPTPMKTNYAHLRTLVEELQVEIPQANPGEEALQLLTAIKDQLTQLVALSTPEEEGETDDDNFDEVPDIDEVPPGEEDSEAASETVPNSPDKAPQPPAHLR